MGVSADHLGGNGVDYIRKGKEIFLLVEVVEEQDLEKEISQFFADVAGIVVVDRLEQFVGLLDKVLLEGLGGLFFIPGASVRGSEATDNFKEGKEFFRGGCHGLPVFGLERGGCLHLHQTADPQEICIYQLPEGKKSSRQRIHSGLGRLGKNEVVGKTTTRYIYGYRCDFSE
jgi:hypothetical protein